MAFSTSDYTDWSLRGEGGEAEIFRARQVSLDRLVAIKRLKLSSIGDANDIIRFEREAKLCASLIHPNLVPIFDYGSEGSFYYLIMEFVYGIDLGKIADLPPISGKANSLDATGTYSRGEKPTLPESLKVHLARQMVEVVDFIQQKGVLHRDLKPENFMADSSARIKLLDLGMAQVQKQNAGQTDPKGNSLKGTLAYIPPEILRGQGSQGMVSEHYSLAVVLLELFQGSRYYRGKSSEEVVNLIQSGIPLDELTSVPPAIKALLAPYLSPILNKRPTSLEPLLRGLKGMQGNTLAIAGGREALDGVIHREQYAWLWAMVRASEGMGRIEDAVARIKELLEVNPEDAEAQAKFQELVLRLNDIPEVPLLKKTPATVLEPVLEPTGSSSIPQTTWLWLATALALLLSVAGGAYYYKHRPRSGDMGRDLMQREMTQLSKEDEVDTVIAGQMALASAPKPSVRPYGILIVSGLPKDFQILINKVRYPTGSEIHLPAAKHLLEIQDKKRHSVIRDSVEVGGGEPTVFDFQRRIGKK